MVALNINSEAWCRKAYLNYHCYDNSMGLTSKDMAKITEAWESRIPSWQNTVSNDENEYEFDDSDYALYKDRGEDAAREETDDYDRKDKDRGAAAQCDTFAGIGTVATLAAAALKKCKGWGLPMMILAAASEAALAALYWIKQPNKDGVEAANEMNNALANAQGTLNETQAEMAAMNEELVALSDEANETNEKANEDMLENKTEYDMFLKSLLSLQAKIKSGQPLTEEEKRFYQELVKVIGELGLDIEETGDETTEAVQDIYGDMESYQEGYDYAAESMAEVEGMTDYAESFDEKTKKSAKFLGTLMYANAGACMVLAARLFLKAGTSFLSAPVAIAAGVVATAACASNTIAGKQQFDFAKQVGNEIDTRELTQEMNAATNEIYTEEIDGYEGLMSGVEELEMEVPEDTEAPEAVPVSGTSGGESAPKTEDDKKKPKDTNV